MFLSVRQRGETPIVRLTGGLRGSLLTYTCQSGASHRRPGDFPLVQGLTDCYCNFPVMAFIREGVSVFDTRCSPKATQKASCFYLLMDLSGLFPF